MGQAEWADLVAAEQAGDGQFLASAAGTVVATATGDGLISNPVTTHAHQDTVGERIETALGPDVAAALGRCAVIGFRPEVVIVELGHAGAFSTSGQSSPAARTRSWQAS